MAPLAQPGKAWMWDRALNDDEQLGLGVRPFLGFCPWLIWLLLSLLRLMALHLGTRPSRAGKEPIPVFPTVANWSRKPPSH